MTEIDAATGLTRGTFAFGTFRAADSNAFPALVLADGSVCDLRPEWTSTDAILADWDRALDFMRTLAYKRDRPSLEFLSLEALPPVAKPNVLGSGANYRQHVAEMMTHNKFNQHMRQEGENDAAFFQRNLEAVDRRAREGMPFFWTGLHSSLAPPNSTIEIPLVGDQNDWELELACVLRGGGRYLSPEETNDIIAGYAIVNDLGTVSEFRRTDVRWGFDWISKHQPGFKPFGPFIVPKEFFDRTTARIHLRLNGKTMQDWPVEDWIFTPEKVLSYASERIRLMPGDVLLNGSPPGNGAYHGRFLQPGDFIESEITGLGRQRNRVITEDAGGRVPHFGRFPT
jgi:2-keto-4-pentenoate hydratase/2-oxohepta-3-ene-1,7-dioic acid hydratase in catechol pathway